MTGRAGSTGRWLRTAVTVVVVCAVVALLFLVVFPWVEGRLENPVIGVAIPATGAR